MPSAVQLELVGYWHGLSENQHQARKVLANIVSRISNTGRLVGADLGIIRNTAVIQSLHKVGLSYLHNNLETVERLYPFAIGKSPERLQQKLKTLLTAREVGINTTSGMLIGLGETDDDLIELAKTFRQLDVTRVAVNFMDYSTNMRIGEHFNSVAELLTPEYALHVLELLRSELDTHQSLMVGSGVGMYLYRDEYLARALQFIDTLHLGAFINLQTLAPALLDQLDTLGYEVVPPRYFDSN